MTFERGDGYGDRHHCHNFFSLLRGREVKFISSTGIDCVGDSNVLGFAHPVLRRSWRRDKFELASSGQVPQQ